MQIPETPSRVQDLDLMQRLLAYASGDAAWQQRDHGEKARLECDRLYAGLVHLAETVTPLLERIASREMERFTIHDHRHALKVAHLMWHILSPERRSRLTPPEIGLL